jgi:hypothetical protein
MEPPVGELKYLTAKLAKIACLRAERTGRQRTANSHHFRGASGPKSSGASFSVVPSQPFEDV